MAGPGKASRSGKPIVLDYVRERERLSQFLTEGLTPRSSVGRTPSSEVKKVEERVLGPDESLPFLDIEESGVQQSGVRNIFTDVATYTDVTAPISFSDKTQSYQGTDPKALSLEHLTPAERAAIMSGYEFADVTEVAPFTDPFNDSTNYYERIDPDKVHWTTIAQMTTSVPKDAPIEMQSEREILFGYALHKSSRPAQFHQVVQGGLHVFHLPQAAPPRDTVAAFAPAGRNRVAEAAAMRQEAQVKLIESTAWAKHARVDYGTQVFSFVKSDGISALSLSAPRGHATVHAYDIMAWMKRPEDQKGGGYKDVRLSHQSSPDGVPSFAITGSRNGIPMTIRVHVRDAVRPQQFAPQPSDLKKELPELKKEMGALKARHQKKIQDIVGKIEPNQTSYSKEELLAMRTDAAIRSFNVYYQQSTQENKQHQARIRQIHAKGVPTEAQLGETELLEGKILRNQERLILFLEVVRFYDALSR